MLLGEKFSYITRSIVTSLLLKALSLADLAGSIVLCVWLEFMLYFLEVISSAKDNNYYKKNFVFCGYVVKLGLFVFRSSVYMV